MNRKNILQKHAWLLDETPKNVIMGDDLDAVLSTLLFLYRNPEAKVIGVYTGFNRVFFNSTNKKKDKDFTVFIDLDIYRAGTRSLGHHIVRLDGSNQLTGFEGNCNMNELAGRSITNNFVGKYPLGTIHFLLWLYEQDVPDLPFAEQLIWLADSSFINGQPHKFRNNVYEWLHREMPHEPLINGFQKIDTQEFEEVMQKLQMTMKKAGFHEGKGQVTSKYLELTGFQCQPLGNENAPQIQKYFQKLFGFLSAITGWAVPEKQIDLEHLVVLNGTRRSGEIQQYLSEKTLDEFLTKNRVFSYAFPYKNAINFTVI